MTDQGGEEAGGAVVFVTREDFCSAGGLAGAGGIVGTGDFDAAEGGRAGHAIEGGFTGGHARDFEELDAAAVEAEFEGGADGGAEDVEGTAEGSAAGAADVEDGTFVFGEFIGEGDDNGMDAGFDFREAEAEEADAFEGGEAFFGEESAEVVVAIAGEKVGDADAAAGAEGHAFALPSGLGGFGAKDFDDGGGVAGAGRELGDAAGDFEVAFEEEGGHGEGVGDVVEAGGGLV